MSAAAPVPTASAGQGRNRDYHQSQSSVLDEACQGLTYSVSGNPNGMLDKPPLYAPLPGIPGRISEASERMTDRT
jgi:hypothetical protein